MKSIKLGLGGLVVVQHSKKDILVHARGPGDIGVAQLLGLVIGHDGGLRRWRWRLGTEALEDSGFRQ